MTKLTLTSVYTTDKNKDGSPLMSKAGKPYTRMSIKAREYGDKWISGFQNKDNKDWKEGDTVEAIIKENGQYLNFELPKKEEVVHAGMAEIKNMLTEITLILRTMQKNGVRLEGHTAPTDGFPYGIDMENHPLNADFDRQTEEEPPY